MQKIPSIEEQLNAGLEEVRAIKSGKVNINTLRRTKREPLPEYNSTYIRELREKTLNVSQAVLASAFHVSTKTVQSWENGNSVPSGLSQVLLSLMESLPQVRKRLI